MNRLNLVLIVAIVGESAGGAYLLSRPPAAPEEPTPPLPDLAAVVDSSLAGRIRAMAGNCRTTDDWAALGELYLAYGYFVEAEACYRYARDRDPENADRQYYWAFVVERLGRPELAIAGYEKAIALGRHDADECWYCIGMNRLRMLTAESRPVDCEAAQLAFEKAGRFPAARYEHSKLLIRAGKYDEAAGLLDSLAAENPKAVEPALVRHKLEILRNRPAAAAVYADKAKWVIDRLPTPLNREWARLEGLYEHIGFSRMENESALGTLTPGAPGTSLQQKLAEARKMLEDRNWSGIEAILGSDPHDEWEPEVFIMLAVARYQLKRYPEMVQILEEVVARTGSSAKALDALGDGYMALGQPEKAVRAWTQATELGVGKMVKEPYHKLAEYYRKGDRQKADMYESRSQYAAGHEAFWAGHFDEARPLLEEAVKLDPRFAAAWFYLGDTHRNLGQPDKARSAYKRALDLDPNYGRARRGLELLDVKL